MGIVHAKAPSNSQKPFEDASVDDNTSYQKPVERQPGDIRLEGLRARVDRINVDGLGRTKNDIVEDCVRDLFKAKDFEDVLLKAHQTRLKLDALGCFRNIGVYIDTSKGPNATDDGLEVTFNVKEYKRVVGGVTTQVGNNEGVVQVGMRAPNILGRGEKVQMEYSYGSKKTTNFNISFIKPFRGAHRPIFCTSLFQAHSEWPSSGYKLLERGLLFDLGFHSTSLFKHNLQWEATIRDLNVLTRSVSFNVREQSGLSLKSALRHILSVDTRDDIIFPNGGALFRLSTEFAGVGGDVGYVKNEIFVQENYSLIDDFVLQCSLSSGVMSSINNDKKTSIADMFFLGGPLSIRGFQFRGIGPHADGDALGSRLYWAAGLHLFTPLPFRPGRGGFGDLFRTHFFINAGNIGDFQIVDVQNLTETLTENMRISYGLGVALRLGNLARLEVNYCFPYRFDRGDQTHPGVQFGVGVQFL